MLEIAATFLVIAALLAYVNERFIGLPVTIGVMAAALLMSLALIGLDALGLDGGLRQPVQDLLRSIDFSNVLMQGMLSLLLFAGALHVDLGELRARRWQVGALAVVSTVASTAAIGFATWLVLPAVGVELPFLHCLLFGALISPTDPIAVMGILKTAGADKEVEVVMAGESLFNDGIGVVLFSLLLGVLVGGATPTAADAAKLLAHEAGGGLLFGLVLGYATFRMLRSVDSYQVEVLLTLAMVTGGYALASRLHVSGPLAMVVAGLIIGNSGRAFAMSDTTRHYVDLFWEVVDDILN
ncbi:MAG: cation:proton antiporter, partial [Pseudomonadota bacterium]|nr:cation:proton antiporter [Pseudomonadota bacterium]